MLNKKYWLLVAMVITSGIYSAEDLKEDNTAQVSEESQDKDEPTQKELDVLFFTGINPCDDRN